LLRSLDYPPNGFQVCIVKPNRRNLEVLARESF